MIDSYGIELIHPIREGRSPNQLGRKGKSNKRWIVGVKVCWLLNACAEVVAWDWITANQHDQVFRPLAHQFEGQTITLCDNGFRKKAQPLLNLKPCAHKSWPERMVIERVFAALTAAFAAKRLFHRRPPPLQAHCAYLAAAFNLFIAMARCALPLASADQLIGWVHSLPF